MPTAGSKSGLNQEQFHQAIHSSIGVARKKYTYIGSGKRRIKKEVPLAHRCDWVKSVVDIPGKRIMTSVFIDFQQNGLGNKDYVYLKNLAQMGISQYWSRQVDVAGVIFTINVAAKHRKAHSIDVDLEISSEKSYSRSHNSGIIDASFIYNKGFFGSNTQAAEDDFKHVSAHEFGHSVLAYFGGAGLSWGHKGSTNVIFQTVKKQTPGYPGTGEIDLMKYYDTRKNTVPVSAKSIYIRSKADEMDVKRLIWMSDLSFLP